MRISLIVLLSTTQKWSTHKITPMYVSNSCYPSINLCVKQLNKHEPFWANYKTQLLTFFCSIQPTATPVLQAYINTRTTTTSQMLKHVLTSSTKEEQQAQFEKIHKWMCNAGGITNNAIRGDLECHAHNMFNASAWRRAVTQKAKEDMLMAMWILTYEALCKQYFITINHVTGWLILCSTRHACHPRCLDTA